MARARSSEGVRSGLDARPQARGALALVLLAAAAWVAAVDLATNSTGPLWDATSYVDMAEHGLAGNEHLVAPFAYRPAVPLLARFVAGAFDLDVLTGFAIVTRVAVFLLLVLVARLAAALGATQRAALFVQGVCALSFFHLKLPLFFPTLVDAGAFPVYATAFLALASGRTALALALGLVGLAFKEFLLVPCALAAWTWWKQGRRPAAAIAVVLAAAVFFGLRRWIPVERSQQFVDLSSVESAWNHGWHALLRWKRDVNIVFVYASYCLPVWMLATRSRWARWRASPVRAKAPWGIALFLVLLLTMFGGTNVAVFASYALPVQVAVLAVLVGSGARSSELALTLLALLLFNRIPFEIPVPLVDGKTSDAYLDFYAGHGQHLSAATAWRALELAGWIAAAWVLRRCMPPRADAA